MFLKLVFLTSKPPYNFVDMFALSRVLPLFLYYTVSFCVDELNSYKKLDFLPQNLDYSVETLIQKHFEPPSLDIARSNAYYTCLKNAITPLLSHCLSLSSGPETFQPFEKLKISIDLTVCDFVAIDSYSFSSDSEMDVLIKAIINVSAQEAAVFSKYNKSVNKYQEILTLIKQDTRTWTTFTINNQKINKICSEVEQPLQRIKLEKMFNDYSSSIEQILILNQGKLEHQINKLENKIDIKLRFIQYEQELNLNEAKKLFKERLKSTLLQTETVYKKFKKKMKVNDEKLKSLEANQSIFTLKNFSASIKYFSNNFKPFIEYKYIVAACVLLCWSYKMFIVRILAVIYLLTFKVFVNFSDSSTTNLLLSLLILVGWQFNVVKILFTKKSQITIWLLHTVSASGILLNVFELGKEDKKKALIFSLVTFFVHYQLKLPKKINKLILESVLIICFTFVNLGMSLYHIEPNL
ncbi:hypothetical protein QEN19_001063 [Hanseniaspora menglaensis]